MGKIVSAGIHLNSANGTYDRSQVTAVVGDFNKIEPAESSVTIWPIM
jgi:hypothetical protein